MKKWISTWMVLLMCMSTAGIVQANQIEQEKEVTIYRIRITDKELNPNIIQVRQGKPFRLEIRNTGKKPHNFTLPELNIYSYNLRSGERMKLQMQIDRRGSYKFYSDAPGEPETDLTGKLVVW
ncbi:cupredoxin domain-containing protein [Effusibacillus consociatus]|uniref:Cupredoxin domain-containing protein n=1 Tax=Effusibacillus consociatus TaxID=1117041 RepID=A0ABV9Q167_9BACL